MLFGREKKLDAARPRDNRAPEKSVAVVKPPELRDRKFRKHESRELPNVAIGKRHFSL